MQCYDKLEGEAVGYELLLSILLGVWSRLFFGGRVCVIVLALLLLLLNTMLNGAEN